MFKSWKTTLGGACAGAAIVALQLYQTGTTDVKTLITAFAIALVGALAQDAQKKQP